MVEKCHKVLKRTDKPNEGQLYLKVSLTTYVQT